MDGRKPSRCLSRNLAEYFGNTATGLAACGDDETATSSRAQLLRLHLIDQVCQGSGGPCLYKGKNMADVVTAA